MREIDGIIPIQALRVLAYLETRSVGLRRILEDMHGAGLLKRVGRIYFLTPLGRAKRREACQKLFPEIH